MVLLTDQDVKSTRLVRNCVIVCLCTVLTMYHDILVEVRFKAVPTSRYLALDLHFIANTESYVSYVAVCFCCILL